MERYKFDELTNLEKVNYINKEFRRGLSIKILCVNLKIGKTKLSNIIKNEGFIFDKNLRQYCKPGEEVAATTYNTTTNDIVRNVSSSNNGNITGTGIKDNAIVINKNIDSVRPVRVSYYLNIKTKKKIEKLASASNMGISEFLQEFLNISLDKIKIE